jgi:peptidoglycan/LPS O-acetylase OafA/YrhL
MLIGGQASVERLQLSGDEAGTAPGDRAFRPDIQGLRAVAVVLVVLFHAHVPGLTGGYVGVDVFFVISGFVITGVLLREHASTGSTSILNFYGRRVRRIIPAATLVIIAAVIASFVLLGPLSGDQTASDARWASVFLINIHFASTGTNYLSAQLPPSVLQNYWSLAVEEQFYLVYPTIFLLVAGLSRAHVLRRRLGIVLSVAVVVSFVASVVQTHTDPTAAYFSPLPRLWELGLGGLVALGTVSLRRLPPRVAALLSWIGLGAIVLSAFAFSAATPYPGWAVALPVVGAALVIAGGVAKPAYGAENLLRLRPFQWVGLISYSLYLWHWPVLTIAAQHSRSGVLSVTESLWCLLLSVGLSIVTYLLLENPIRRSRFLLSKRWATLVLGACLIASSVAVATVEIHLHEEGTLATPGLANLNTGDACPAPTKEALESLMGNGSATDPKTVARILLVGDSTACTMLPGLQAVGAPAGVRVEDGAVIGCGIVSGEIPPAKYNGRIEDTSRTCQSRANAAEARAMRSGRPNIVLWASTWERSDLVVGSGKHRQVVAAGSPQWYAILQKRMDQRVRQFTATGATVVMLTQPPFSDLGNPTGPTPQDKTFERLNAFLTEFAAHTPHVRLVDLAARVCPSGPPCPLVVDDIALRGDGAHYTGDGSLWVARWLMPQLGIAALDRPVTALPVMRMIKPGNGAVLKSTSLVVSIAAFTTGVSKVDFEITGHSLRNTVIGDAVQEDGLWALSWNTRSVADGVYTLRSVAYNSAGDRSPSKGVRVRVSNEVKSSET